jgi:hypothetical protein
MPMTAAASAAGGSPFGGGGSLHDILRHISADTKETKQALSVAEYKSDADPSAAAVARAKRALAQLAPGLLLRGGRDINPAAQSSLGKRPRVATTVAATTTANHNDQACLDAYRRERDQLAADVDAAADRTTTSTSNTGVQQMRDLAAVYLFGLERVGALQELRQAPDAILPGNFVEPPPVAVAAATVATVATTTTHVELAKAPIAVVVPVAASTETKTTLVADAPTN